MTKKSNKITNFIFGLIFSLLIIAGSIHTYIKDVDINLEKSRFIIGRVTYTDIRDVKRFTIKRRAREHKRVFYFKLHNSNQNFIVHRTYEGYDDIDAAIKKGDTIKVYFRPSGRKYNDNVFQVEKDKKIIAHYYEYNKVASEVTGLGLFLGVFLFAYMILWFINFDLIQFLMNIVSVKRPNTIDQSK